jgi:predicted aspartyl protease
VGRYVLFTCLSVVAATASATTDPIAELKLEMRAGRPVVDGVYVGGHGPYRFLVDTGATINTLDRRLAESAGLRSTFQTKMTSSTSTTLAPAIDGVTLRVGSITVGGQAVLLTDVDAVHAIGRDIDGVLGQIFLSQFDYLLDLRNRTLAFGAPSNGRTGMRLPFFRLDGRPVIVTSLGSLILDSGTHAIIRFRVSGSAEDTPLLTATGSVMVGTIFSRLEIGGRQFWSGDALALPASPETGADGLLPVSPYKSIYVSNTGSYVILE